jgi:hypothetical protein
VDAEIILDEHDGVSVGFAREGLCVVVDCHSFSANPLPPEPDQDPYRPTSASEPPASFQSIREASGKLISTAMEFLLEN